MKPLPYNEECGSCGGHVGPSDSYPWHYDHEDCRAIRAPLTRVTITRETERDHEEEPA